jgi:RNase P/RNase MRP subunit p29
MIEKSEFIGKFAKITYNDRKFEGTIINETKNTIQLETKNKNITIIKKNAIIEIDGKSINGNYITKRPEDRIKAC